MTTLYSTMLFVLLSNSRVKLRWVAYLYFALDGVVMIVAMRAPRMAPSTVIVNGLDYFCIGTIGGQGPCLVGEDLLFYCYSGSKAIL